jgi:hypothetical protein
MVLQRNTQHRNSTPLLRNTVLQHNMPHRHSAGHRNSMPLQRNTLLQHNTQHRNNTRLQHNTPHRSNTQRRSNMPHRNSAWHPSNMRLHSNTPRRSNMPPQRNTLPHSSSLVLLRSNMPPQRNTLPHSSSLVLLRNNMPPQRNTLPHSSSLVLLRNSTPLPRPGQSRSTETSRGKAAIAEPDFSNTRTHGSPWVFVRLVAGEVLPRHRSRTRRRKTAFRMQKMGGQNPHPGRHKAAEKGEKNSFARTTAGSFAKRLKTERAARQQGSSFLRENSSNGGKTIRTFWLHSRGGGRECQGEIEQEISAF